MNNREHCWSLTALWAAVMAAVCAGASDRVQAATDRYERAVAHAGRAASDLKRDGLDHPAGLLRLTGIGPGMRVADFLAGDGYYSELASYLVGPGGQVLMINNGAFEKWSADGLLKRQIGQRLPNVEHRVVELGQMHLPAASLDAALLIKVYHDLYWVDATKEWPAIDTATVLDDIARAIKPGGVLLLVDHSAIAGTGKGDAGRLHRIDEAYARADFATRGFSEIAHSDLLRRADDKRDQISYQEPMLGKTDRFVLVFRKRR